MTYVEVLRRQYPQRLGKQPTVLQFYMHVARLGGHQNRKVDGFPGWITLWRGWMKLESMVKHGLTPLDCALRGTGGIWARFSEATLEDWRRAAEMISAAGGKE